ncbi:MAG: DAK2 domain-containing protein, partial [Thermomicrobiales bacterium]|nr:DAK2 domain-containing protein [Thermomicrobiales bacterium]
AAAMARAIAAATETLQRMGGAQAGDKTMLDTLIPFSKALAAAANEDASVSVAWAAALPAAAAGMLSTVDMISRRGRASRLGERSRGTQDAGATSMYYVLQAFGDAFKA